MEDQDNLFGMKSANAELLNGRMAMLGFVIGIATELITGQGILQQLNLM